MIEALRELAKALHAEADNRRERAIVADGLRGGSTTDEVVDRWASSFATAYQTLRGAALACEAAAIAMEARSGETACGLDPKDDSAGGNAASPKGHDHDQQDD